MSFLYSANDDERHFKVSGLYQPLFRTGLYQPFYFETPSLFFLLVLIHFFQPFCRHLFELFLCLALWCQKYQGRRALLLSTYISFLWCYFLGSKITADGDCSHEIKRHLLLGRKVMTNLDSILKSRDITLPTKVCLVKAMVFPVVMYGCESWTVKKAEC